MRLVLRRLRGIATSMVVWGAVRGGIVGMFTLAGAMLGALNGGLSVGQS